VLLAARRCCWRCRWASCWAGAREPVPRLRWPVTALVFVVRGRRCLMVIFWAYFFLPSVTGVKTDQFTTMLIALVLFDAVYLAEIVRAGIQGAAERPDGRRPRARA
jgi:polar amino acid transport system permease protein